MIPRDALRFMGVTGTPDKEVIALAEEAYDALLPQISKKHRIIISSVAGESLDCAVPLLGSDIKRHLEGCPAAAVLVATLGAGADMLIRRTQLTSMAKAVAIDAVASALLEEYCDEICGSIKGISTPRFSPGYGDFPIEAQPFLLNACKAHKIGVSCLESLMMIPSKTVSAILGIQSGD